MSSSDNTFVATAVQCQLGTTSQGTAINANSYCGSDNNNAIDLCSCTGNGTCVNKDVEYDTDGCDEANSKNIGICGLRSTSTTTLGSENPGCPSSNPFQYCRYDVPGDIADAWVCTTSDIQQCPVYPGKDIDSATQPSIPIFATSVEFVRSGCVEGFSTLTPTQQDTSDPRNNANINCTYNLDDFTPITAQQWLDGEFSNQNGIENCGGGYNKGGTFANIATETIFPYVCAQPASKYGLQQFCPKNIGGFLMNTQMTDCSLITVNDPNNWGDTCRNWCRTDGTGMDNDDNLNTTFCNIAISNYCGTSADNDCACVNALQIPDIAKINAVSTARNLTPYECWFGPCKVPQGAPYLISDSNMDAIDRCPTNLQVCQALFAIFNNQDAQINLSNIGIDCTQTQTNTDTSGISTQAKIIGIILIIIIVLIVFLVIGIIIYDIFFKKKKPNPTDDDVIDADNDINQGDDTQPVETAN